jgi:hypothetical protein
MNPELRNELLRMAEHDRAVRAELAADGSLFEGYHPRMEQVHRHNAARLREVIAGHGWPGRALVGEDGAEAAWRIAQHAVGEPDFMRLCRDLLDEASGRGEVPRWQFAYTDDRVRVFEGRPQRYGTQLRDGPDGPEPHPLEDADWVDELRRSLGLAALADILAEARKSPPPKPKDQAARDAAELAWRKRVGWIA